MLTDAEVAERAARAFAARSRWPGTWRELVGAAWEGVHRRAASRARRGLPPMDGRQRYLAARSGIVDYLRVDAPSGGFGDHRAGRPAYVAAVSGFVSGDLERTGRYGVLEPHAPEARPDPDRRLAELWEEVRGLPAARTGRPLGERPAHYLRLYAVAGLTYQEIAAREGRTETAVSNALRPLMPPGLVLSVSAARRPPA